MTYVCFVVLSDSRKKEVALDALDLNHQICDSVLVKNKKIKKKGPPSVSSNRCDKAACGYCFFRRQKKYSGDCILTCLYPEAVRICYQEVNADRQNVGENIRHLISWASGLLFSGGTIVPTCWYLLTCLPFPITPRRGPTSKVHESHNSWNPLRPNKT